MPRPRKWYPGGNLLVVDKCGRLRTRRQRIAVEDVRAWLQSGRERQTIQQQEQNGNVSTQQQEERDTIQDIPLDSTKRGSIQDLRDMVMTKMSKIAKSQLGLAQFPYERVRKGDVIITGIPPSLMPLQPPGRLTTKELLQILDCEVTVTRAPSVRDSTHTSHTNQITENMLQQTQTPLVHGTSTSHSENEAKENTLQQAQTQLLYATSTSHADEKIENRLQQRQTQLVHATTSSSADNEATGNILRQIQTQLLHNTSTHTNSTLDTNRQTRLLEHNLQMSYRISTAETCDGRTPGHATEVQSPSQLIADKRNQPDDHTNTTSPEVSLKELPKAKRTRVTWDTMTIKALEDSLGPLGAVDHIPSSTEIEKIRQNNPVLAKFDINQIYQKIYKSRMKGK